MKQKNINVGIDETTWRMLRQNAKREGRVFSFYVKDILESAARAISNHTAKGGSNVAR